MAWNVLKPKSCSVSVEAYVQYSIVCTIGYIRVLVLCIVCAFFAPLQTDVARAPCRAVGCE